MKKRILVDMDGVLADVYSRFFDLHEEESGVRLSINDVAGLLVPFLANYQNQPF